MPLSMVKVGESARVTGITGADAVRRHLGNLGFSVGTVVRVVGETNGGMIVGIQGTRIALDNALARRINCSGIEG